MRVLIVDDKLEQSIFTGQLSVGVYQPAPRVEMISLAGGLETALRLLPEHAAVLTDGQIPISSTSYLPLPNPELFLMFTPALAGHSLKDLGRRSLSTSAVAEQLCVGGSL